MTQIFISHSQKDKQMLGYFESIFAGTPLVMYRAEFEKLKKPPSSEIKTQIENSAAVFILLGSHITDAAHTQSWVSWESGIANESGKEIWVFEEKDKWIDFVIPAPNHYVIYDPKQREDWDRIKEIISSYDPTPRLAAVAFGGILGALFGKALFERPLEGAATGGILAALATNPMIKGIEIECPHKDCGAIYILHADIEGFLCPTCRQGIELK